VKEKESMDVHRADHERVITAYSDTVFRLAYSMLGNKSDAEDAYQDVFLRYVRKDPSFRDAEHEKAWFLRVTVNCAKSLLLSPARKRTQTLSDTEGEYLMNDRTELYELVKSLSPVHKTVIHLFYYEDMPVSKMSEILGRKESTIRSLLSRARLELRERMKGECYEI
jgi:RNA polymerase sigma-70 factor (ECF subfamily)